MLALPMQDASITEEISLLVLRAVPAGAAREAAVRLLTSAGRSESYVRASCDQGHVFLFAGIDAGPGPPAGALVGVPRDGGRSIELRVVALPPPAAATGREMLGQFADLLRSRGADRVVTATGDHELALMTVLVGAGFRFHSVDPDGCTPDRGFAPGQRDLVRFELEL